MDFHYFTDALKKYAIFDGRTTRTEYWMFQLYRAIIILFLMLMAQHIKPMVFVLIIAWVGTLLPSWAAGVRRLHDTNNSGWMILIPIVSLIYACSPSDPNANRYG